MTEYYDSEEEIEQPVDLLALLFKYLSYWKWFVASIVICLLLAIVYLKTTTNIYEVSTTVLLKDDKKGGGMSELSALKDMGLFDVKNNVDNELEVLKTATLTEQVVRELGLYAQYTNVGTFKNESLYGASCPIRITLPTAVLDSLSGSYEFEVLVRTNGKSLFTGTYDNVAFNVQANSTDSMVRLPFGTIGIAKGAFKPAEDMTVGVKLLNPGVVAESMLANTSMELTSKTTTVVNVVLTTSNILMGKDFLNKLIEVYNREDMKDQNLVATNTAAFIDERLLALTKELGIVETEVENYKQNQGLTDITSEAQMFIGQTGEFAQKRLEVETQLAIVTDIDNYMHRKENYCQLLPASTGVKSENLNSLITDYNTLVLQRKRLARTASATNKAMIEMDEQIESMFSTLLSSIRNEKRSWQIAQKDLLAKDGLNNVRIKAIPRQEREYTVIKRQQSIKEALFVFLLQKKEENSLTMSVVVPKGKIIDKTRSNGIPVSPKKMVVLLMSFLLGLIIPVVTIAIRDMLRYHIDTKEELEKLSEVPVLGEIPTSADAGNVIIKANSTDSFTEMVRLLRSNLLFVMNTPDKKVINVESSVSGEGKTFVSINLAMSLALLNKKVLVIGLDIRKPKLGQYLGIEHETGITLYLSGHMGKEQLVRPSGIHPNLSVITAGPVPPNPNELLATPLLDELINELRTQYDYIVIDTAPIGIVSDSFAINRFADVSLYVVRAGYTPKHCIEEATTLFKREKVRNMYFVLNGTDIHKKSYRYGYGKKYGYGYGKKHGATYGYGQDN